MVSIPPSPIGALLPRHAARRIAEAMADTRVVLVNGARQTGKSTLVMQAGKLRDALWRSLDDAETLRFAMESPMDFVETEGTMIIDEIQRAPELMLAIKHSVDHRPWPGKYLLTGSARVLGLRALPDSLVGRMETIELWPLSQGEIDRKPDGFVDAIFREGPDFRHVSDEGRNDYIERMLRGGFPEAVARSGRRRARFFNDYVSDLINRDVMQLEEIRRSSELHRMVGLLAANAGQLVVANRLAAKLGLSQPTVSSYLGLLEEVFLIKRIPAWAGGFTGRVTKTPKLALVDTGLAAHLLQVDSHRLRQPGSPIGQLLENFVAMELARQMSWADFWGELYHYRTRDQVEVDVVLERRGGEMVGIEVKAAQLVKPEDFRGLRHLRDQVGDAFVVGVVFYTGKYTLAVDDRLLAVPVAALWESGVEAV